MHARLVKNVWAKDWNGESRCIASGRTGVVDDGIFTTSDKLWRFPVAADDYELYNSFRR